VRKGEGGTKTFSPSFQQLIADARTDGGAPGKSQGSPSCVPYKGIETLLENNKEARTPEVKAAEGGKKGPQRSALLVV